MIRAAHDAREFLEDDGKPYAPSGVAYDWSYSRNQPPFTLSYVHEMLWDPRVTFGLYLLKGPLFSKARIYVNCKQPQIKQHLIQQITRFWSHGLKVALRMVEWGYSCCESIYRVQEGLMALDYLRGYEPFDCQPLVGKKSHKVTGALVTPRFTSDTPEPFTVRPPRLFWGVHSEEQHLYYGQSRLRGAYRPWLEATCEGGFRDSRRLFYYKYAFSGGGWRYPVGTTPQYAADASNPIATPNEWIARDMGDKARAGAAFYVPNVQDMKGNPLWDRIPPDAPVPPQGLQEYGLDLRDEILEGLGIPPEVGKAQGTGAYAGRLIPMVAYYSVIGDILSQVIRAGDHYIWRPLVDFNFGRKYEYELTPFDMSQDVETDMQEKKRPSKMKEGYNDKDEKGKPPNKKDSQMSTAIPQEEIGWDEAQESESFIYQPSTGQFFKAA